MSDLETLIRQSLRGQAERAPSPTTVEQAVLQIAGTYSDPAPPASKRLLTGVWPPVLGVAASVALIVVGATGVFRGDDPPPTPSAPVGVMIPLSTSDWRPGDLANEALMDGTLRVAENGCVYLEGPTGSRTDVVWPAGWTAHRLRDGSVELREDHGQVQALTGQHITAGGGQAGPQDLVCRALGAEGVFAVQSFVTVVK
ncbi:MAG: hypothetical protein M3423_06495 [Actinomycetota bacterium]|nr:hypothetical protein [Actinomycetota bacterium]